MGISFSGLIPVREIGFEDLRGRTIAIDSSNVLYQFLSTIRDRFTGEPLKDSKGRVTSHLSGLFYRTARLIENGIDTVYVFDGKMPEFKRHTVEARVKIREEARKKWKQALAEGRTEDVRKHAQAATRLTSDMVDEAKRLLDAMGIAWVQAPSEAEAQASYMASKGVVWATGSQDWDALLFNTPRLVRNLTISGRKKLPGRQSYVATKPEIVELGVVLKELGINHDQLICLGILIGTDFNPGGVHGLGPKTALKVVKEHKKPHNIFKSVEWKFDILPEVIFDFFKQPPVEKKPEIKPKNIDIEKVRTLMVDEYNFSEERINSTIEKLQNRGKDRSQSKLGKFF
jgi:flap endonuclease-1